MTTLTKTSLIGGVWEGVLSGTAGGAEPKVLVTHLMNPVTDVSVSKDGDNWRICVPVPVASIADGVQTFVISDAETGDVLNSFAILAGEAVAEDMRAELDLLRGELDLLKRAFRRHCVETM